MNVASRFPIFMKQLCYQYSLLCQCITWFSDIELGISSKMHLGMYPCSGESHCKYSRPSIIRTSLIRTLDCPNYQINDIHSICVGHQIELTYLPIENILLHLSEYSVIRMAWIDLVTKGVRIRPISLWFHVLGDGLCQRRWAMSAFAISFSIFLKLKLKA